jgi:hypothetical protein
MIHVTAHMSSTAHLLPRLIRGRDRSGRLDAASAALAAVDLDVALLTAQPGLYGGMADGGPVIPV